MAYILVFALWLSSEDGVTKLYNVKPTMCEVVGWLIKEDDKYYYVSNWVSRDVKTVYDISGILKSTVIENQRNQIYFIVLSIFAIISLALKIAPCIILRVSLNSISSSLLRVLTKDSSFIIFAW